MLVKTFVGITTSQPHADQKPTKLPKAQSVEKQEYLCSSGSVGSSEKWWEKTMECFCYLRNKQGQLRDRTLPYERRFGTPFDGAVIPFGASFSRKRQQSSKQVRRLKGGVRPLGSIFSFLIFLFFIFFQKKVPHIRAGHR